MFNFQCPMTNFQVLMIHLLFAAPATRFWHLVAKQGHDLRGSHIKCGRPSKAEESARFWRRSKTFNS